VSIKNLYGEVAESVTIKVSSVVVNKFKPQMYVKGAKVKLIDQPNVNVNTVTYFLKDLHDNMLEFDQKFIDPLFVNTTQSYKSKLPSSLSQNLTTGLISNTLLSTSPKACTFESSKLVPINIPVRAFAVDIEKTQI
jgi:hypothetical protein